MALNQRIPRPRGTTFLAINYQQSDNKQESKKKLLQHLITIYTLDGFRYQGQSLSIPNLAILLRIDQKTILQEIGNLGQNMGYLNDPQSIHETLKSIATLSTSFTLQDRGLIQNQLELLIRAQGTTYRPFISSEVNRSLKLLLESNRALQELYKTFYSDSPTTNILNVHTTIKDPQSTQTLLTPERALELISEQERKGLTYSKPTYTAAERAVNAGGSEFSDVADQLFRDHNLGELQPVQERRIGTESLRPPKPQGPATHATNPPLNLHEDHYFRRGLEIEDTDILP